MKLLLDDGTEILLENIKIIECKESDKIIINVKDGTMSQEELEDSLDYLTDFFKPIKVCLFQGDIDINIIRQKVDENN
jgi:hypothetical protein